MAFYRKRVTYADLAPFVQKFLTLLRDYGKAFPTEDRHMEVFLMDKTAEDHGDWLKEYTNSWMPLANANYIHVVPYDVNHVIVYVDPRAEGPSPTVSPTYVRLPKLSYLITLTHADFFKLMRLVASAKNTQSGDSLSLNLPEAGINSFADEYIYKYFTKLMINYRFNPETSDRKWTSRAAIRQIANLAPLRENHLLAMQYLTVLQNADVLFMPAESSIDLEVEWPQVNADYVQVPKGF